MTRSEWFASAVPLLAIHVFGYPLPPIRVTCVWPGGRRSAAYSKRIGNCWPREHGANLVFVSPRISDPLIALEILVHELVHAIDDCQSGHRGNFKRIAQAIGLEGRMSQTLASPSLRAKLVIVRENLGEFPL
jgi:hypothetical protein